MADFTVKNLHPTGDWHNGHKNFMKKKLEHDLNKTYKKGYHLIGTGDYCEIGTRYSFGTFTQTEFATEQIEYMIDKFQPFADDNLLLGLLSGNHEDRLMRQSGLDIVKIVCKTLKVPYFNGAFFGNINNFKVLATHGAGAATTTSGRLRVFQKLERIYDADIYIVAHFHKLFYDRNVIYIDENIVKIKHHIMTGSYLDYWNSYAHKKLLQPNEHGAYYIKFLKNDIEVKKI